MTVAGRMHAICSVDQVSIRKGCCFWFHGTTMTYRQEDTPSGIVSRFPAWSEQLRRQDISEAVPDMIQCNDGGLLGVTGGVVGCPDHDHRVGYASGGTKPDPDHQAPSVGPR